jgi:hypothetical protein
MIWLLLVLWGACGGVGTFTRLENNDQIYFENGHFLLHNAINLTTIWEEIKAGEDMAKTLEKHKLGNLETQKNALAARIRADAAANKQAFDALLEDTSPNIRNNRAIEFLGDIIHAIAGNPTAAQWRDNVKIVAGLSAAINGQQSISKTMIKSINKNSDSILDLDRADIKLANTLDSIKLRINLENNTLWNFISITSFAEAAVQNQRRVANKINAVHIILLEGKHGLLSQLMVPKTQLRREIAEIASNVQKKGLFPLYTGSDSVFYYTLSATTTFIHNNAVHSVLAIPLINYDRRWISFRLDLEHFQLNTELTPSVILVDHLARFVTFISKKNEQLCKKANQGYVCPGRPVDILDKMPLCVQTQSCNVQIIPSTFFIEADNSRYFFSSNKNLSVHITCEVGMSKKINLGFQGQVVVPPNCILTGEFLKLQALDDFEGPTHLLDFNLVNQPVPPLHLRFANESARSLVNDMVTKLNLHEENFSTLQKDLNATRFEVNSSYTRLLDAENSNGFLTAHLTPGYVVSALLAIASIIAIACIIKIMLILFRSN